MQRRCGKQLAGSAPRLSLCHTAYAPVSHALQLNDDKHRKLEQILDTTQARRGRQGLAETGWAEAGNHASRAAATLSCLAAVLLHYCTVQFLQKICKNVRDNPSEDKFRKVGAGGGYL